MPVIYGSSEWSQFDEDTMSMSMSNVNLYSAFSSKKTSNALNSEHTSTAKIKMSSVTACNCPQKHPDQC